MDDLVPAVVKGTDYPGRCMGCGFLSKLRMTAGYPMAFYEMDWATRFAAGDVFSQIDERRNKHPTVPFCFQYREDFVADVAPLNQGDSRTKEQQAARSVFEKDRRCPDWIPYRPALDPIGHFGGLAMQQQEQRQYDFQKNMEQDRRRFEIIVTALLAVVAVAEVTATVVGIFVS